PQKWPPLSPARALMTSAPPRPWIVSSPGPVVMVLADAEPVTDSAVVIALAFRFSKFLTRTESPEVWSTPAATAKLTAVTVALAPSTSVSEPEPPSIEVSAPRSMTVSSPHAALITSQPPRSVSAGWPPLAAQRTGSRAAGDDVRPARSRDGRARGQRGGIDVLEIRDVCHVSGGLIRVGEIDAADRGLQDQRVRSAAAV